MGLGYHTIGSWFPNWRFVHSVNLPEKKVSIFLFSLIQPEYINTYVVDIDRIFNNE